MKLTLNTLNNSNSNSTLYNLQNLFNKTFNNIHHNSIAALGKKRKEGNKRK